MHSRSGTPRIGKSKETFHSGFNVLLIVGVDCRASPKLTTKYCVNWGRQKPKKSQSILERMEVTDEQRRLTGSLNPFLSLGARFLPCKLTTQLASAPSHTLLLAPRSRRYTGKQNGVHTDITVALRNNGLVSGLEGARPGLRSAEGGVMPLLELRWRRARDIRTIVMCKRLWGTNGIR